MTRVTKQPSARHGTTTVEFALTAPILFLLVLGAVEFSRANVIRHTAVVAATEAARKSIVRGATAQDCIDTAYRELSAVGVMTASVDIDPPEILFDTEQVSVIVEIPLDSSNGFILPGFIKGKKISKAVTLQRELAKSKNSTEPKGKSANANAKGP